MKSWKYKIHFIATEFFQYSLFTYFLLFIADNVQKGFVSNVFNLDILLTVVLISGYSMILTSTDQIKKHASHEEITSAEIQNMFAVTLLAGLLVYYQTQSLGYLSFVYAGITVLLTIIAAIVIFTQKE